MRRDSHRPGGRRSGLTTAAALLLALTAGAAGAAGAPKPGDAALQRLMASITDWIVARTDLPAPEAMPKLVRLPAAQLEAIRHNDSGQLSGVEGLYDPRRRTIFVTEAWVGATPAEQSLLVHELVHHLQAADGRRFACPAEQEVAAYAAQQEWLAAHGTSLQAAYGIDAMTLLVRTTCTY